MASIIPGDRLDHSAGIDHEDLDRAQRRLIALLAHAVESGKIPTTRAHIGDVPVFVAMVPGEEPGSGMPAAILIDRAVFEAIQPDTAGAVKEPYEEED